MPRILTVSTLTMILLTACGRGDEPDDAATEASAANDDNPLALALAEITEDRLSGHLAYLADDERLGRMTGTQGY